jgi:hypothetical protein
VTGGVCVVGSINVDTTLRVRTLPGPGETVLASKRRTAHGGKGANQAAAAGEDVAFVGAVGTDEQGDAALENLARRGVDVVGVARDPDHPTGSAVVVVSVDGNNLIVVDPGANAGLRPDWVSSHVERLGPAVILGQRAGVAGRRAGAQPHRAGPAGGQGDPEDRRGGRPLRCRARVRRRPGSRARAPGTRGHRSRSTPDRAATPSGTPVRRLSRSPTNASAPGSGRSA